MKTDLSKANRGRVRSGNFESLDSDGPNGAFFFRIGRTDLKVIASNGEGWEHVSVSARELNGHERCPTWTEMCAIKDLFWEETECVVQFHPPRSEYVNNHAHCLHMWRPTDATLPLPPSILVGIK